MQERVMYPTDWPENPSFRGRNEFQLFLHQITLGVLYRKKKKRRSKRGRARSSGR